MSDAARKDPSEAWHLQQVLAFRARWARRTEAAAAEVIVMARCALERLREETGPQALARWRRQPLVDVIAAGLPQAQFVRDFLAAHDAQQVVAQVLASGHSPRLDQATA